MKKILFAGAAILLLAASCQQGGVKGNNKNNPSTNSGPSGNNGQQASSTSENSQNLPQGEKNGWNTYSNSEWWFEIKYPNSFKVYTDAGAIRKLAFIPPCDPTGLVCLFYSSDNQKNTDFEGAGVSVSPIDNRSASEADCARPYEGQTSVGQQTINGIRYAVLKGTGAATGHFKDYKAYRTFQNNMCMEVVLSVVAADVGGPEGGAPREFNANEVWSKLDQVLSTFKFTNGRQSSGAGPMPKMTFKLLGSQCVQNNEYSRFALFADGKQVATVQSPLCEVNEITFLKGDSNVVYFEIKPSGLGGYYSYMATFNLYKLNLANKSAVKIDTGNYWMSGVDFNSDLTRVAYAPYELEGRGGPVTVLNLQDGSKQVFDTIPARGEQRVQIGNVKFSPDYKKVAIAVAYGPDKEYGEIYILDLITKQYSLYKRTDSGHIQVNGWKNNSEVDWSTIP